MCVVVGATVPCFESRGPIFEKSLRQSYENIWIFVQYTPMLRQIYDITTIMQTLLTL